ncbi:MAG: hypothetical protein KC912_11760 [Proteobacteria bacterium]|nr:hypothetical protein [Pseudomonadota bacterium]
MVALTAALGLSGGVWFAAGVYGWTGPPELGDPRLRNGASVTLTLATVVSIEPERAILEKTPERYVVLGTEPWQVGEDWTVGGTWRDGQIAAEWATQHPGRGGKKGLGVLGLLLVGVLLPVGIRGRPGRWVIRG